MQVYKDGRIAHYREFFPNVSFPASGPSDEYLAGAGAVKVNMFLDHDRATQKLVSCEPYVQDGWAYVVRVEDKTAEDLAADVAAESARVRSTRNRLLAESDWTQVLDAPVDRAAWANYRQALRDVTLQAGFPSNVTWPSKPE